MRFAPLALAAGCAALALPATAQTTLTPGSPELVAAPPQSFDYEVRYAGEVPRVIGSVTQTQTRDGDRLVTLFHLSVPMGNQDQRDSTVVAWPSLAPLHHVSRSGDDEVETMTVAGGQIRGNLHLGNLDEPIEAALPADAFGPGIETQLVRSLPFAAGYTATFQIADFRGDLKTDTLRVTGPEPFLRANGTETPVWLVEVVRPSNPTRTYAIDTDTREILHMSFVPRPGTTVEMAEALPPPTGPVLRPGDAALDTGWMTDRTESFVLRVVEPMQMEAGTSTVTLRVADGVVTSETVLSVPMQGLEQTVTARADAATLAPQSHTVVGAGATTLAYTDAGVSGTRTPPESEPVAVDAMFEAPVFDSAFGSEIAQSLPLEEGYTARVEAYDSAAQGVYSVTYRVTGQEDVDGTMAWAVQSVAPTGEVTFFVDPASRALLKMRMSPQPGVIVEMVRQ